MSIKRTIITTILALALVAMVAPVSAQALTTAEQIAQLMATINGLSAQLQALQGGSAATPVPTGIVACSGVTFERTLVVGSTGSDVKCLQVLLNTNGYTLAATGAGSPGMETSFFGPATLAAVKAFQTAKGWTPANQVGPMTRAALNALITGTVGTTPGSGTGAGALCPNGNTVASSCTVSPNGGSVALCPNGNTIASNCSTGVTTPVLGTTGFLSIPQLAAIPASNATVTTTANVPVLGVDLKAIGSNMTVSSAKVELAITGGEYPSILVNSLSVYDGGVLLGTYPVNANTIIKDGAHYYVILSGFSFNLPGNTTKTLTINANFAPSLETNRTLTINLYGTTDAVRGTDTSGAYSSAGSTATRVYTVTYGTVNTSTLTVTADTGTPLSTTINVNATSGRTDVPMLLVDAKSTTGASMITDLKFTLTGDATALDNVTAIALYDGSALLSSATPVLVTATNYTATFTNLTISVAQDATKALTVRANFAATAAAPVAGLPTGVIVSIAAPATNVTYQEPNMTSAHPTSAAVTGNEMYLLNGVSADLAFMSATSSYTYNSTSPTDSYSTGVVTFKAHANGGTMLALTNATADTKVIGAWNTTNTLGTTSINVDFAPVGGVNGNAISDGGDAIVTVTMTVPRATSGTGFVTFNIPEIDWTVGGTVVHQTWGLGSYKTPTVNVQ